MKVVTKLSPRDYDAVLFDLDGVLTRTASAHAAAWKKLFDDFLEQRATQAPEPYVPFDIDTDYPRYVDGKPRYDGVAAFLESRGIELPLGAPEDGSDVQSVRALGELKDRYFLQHLGQHGVEPYAAAIALVRALRAQEFKTAVVSSSNNCAAVLESAGIAQLFDARVDGKDVTRLEIKGKPAPDAFLEAARRVGAEPARAVVVEDAIVGVAAGHAGQFGCVIGVDRSGRIDASSKQVGQRAPKPAGGQRRRCAAPLQLTRSCMLMPGSMSMARCFTDVRTRCGKPEMREGQERIRDERNQGQISQEGK